MTTQQPLSSSAVDAPLDLTTPPPVPASAHSSSSATQDAHSIAKHVAVMPGSSERNARAIGAVSPEGRPSDPKVGPAGIRGRVWIMVLAVVAAIGISAIWIGWLALPLGGVALAMLAVNPAVWAARGRAHDREVVLEDRLESGELTVDGSGEKSEKT